MSGFRLWPGRRARWLFVVSGALALAACAAWQYYAPSSREWAMMEACCTGDVAAIERLVRQGAPLDKIDYWGMRPMEWAAFSDQPAVVALLARLGAPVSVTDGRIPLKLAVGA